MCIIIEIIIVTSQTHTLLDFSLPVHPPT